MATFFFQEIILHTLFESGISGVQDLERYLADDVERYGSRLGDIEKKLVGAYREVVSIFLNAYAINRLLIRISFLTDFCRSIGG